MNQLLETQLTTATVLAANGVIPVGTVIHKRGCGVSAQGNSISIKGSGYYKITAIANVEPTAATELTITMAENGTAIATATEAPAAAGSYVNLALAGIVYNACGCANDSITFTVDSAGTVNNLTVIVERI